MCLRFPLPPPSVPRVGPPDIRHAEKRSHQQSAIIERDLVILRLQHTQVHRAGHGRWLEAQTASVAAEDDTGERRAKEGSHAADEVDGAVHARVVLHAVHLGDRRGEERVVSPREDAVGDDEGGEAGAGRGGPEC